MRTVNYLPAVHDAVDRESEGATSIVAMAQKTPGESKSLQIEAAETSFFTNGDFRTLNRSLAT